MTKPKSFPHRSRKGRPGYPSLEIYVRFEATRRLRGKSINAHAKTFAIYLIGGHLLVDTIPMVTGEALRRHIQKFKREQLAQAGPAMRAALEKQIAAEMDVLENYRRQNTHGAL